MTAVTTRPAGVRVIIGYKIGKAILQAAAALILFYGATHGLAAALTEFAEKLREHAVHAWSNIVAAALLRFTHARHSLWLAAYALLGDALLRRLSRRLQRARDPRRAARVQRLAGQDLEQIGVEMTEHRALHRREHAGGDVARTGAAEQPHGRIQRWRCRCHPDSQANRQPRRAESRAARPIGPACPRYARPRSTGSDKRGAEPVR